MSAWVLEDALIEAYPALIHGSKDQKQAIRRLRTAGMPHRKLHGSLIVYRFDEVESWIESRGQTPTIGSKVRNSSNGLRAVA